MPTAAERQALHFLLGIALLGGGARLWAAGEGEPPGGAGGGPSAALQRQRAAVDSARRESGARAPRRDRAARPGAPAPTRPLSVAVNEAGVAELERLPRVGPALARRIVADREIRGPFPSLEALGRVPGIGPATLGVLAPHVTFSPPPSLYRVGGRGRDPLPPN